MAVRGSPSRPRVPGDNNTGFIDSCYADRSNDVLPLLEPAEAPGKFLPSFDSSPSGTARPCKYPLATISENGSSPRKTKLAKLERILLLLSDIGLSPYVLDEACASNDAREVLLSAIRENARGPESIWARLVPVITGERTPEQYAVAIDMTLRLRREVKALRKKAMFWKRLAKEDASHLETITPSPSSLSLMREGLSNERQAAVDTLQEKRKHGGSLFPGLQESARESIVLPLTQMESSAPIFAGSFSSNASDSITTIRQRYATSPSPLANQSHREELALGQSSSRIFGTRSSQGLSDTTDTRNLNEPEVADALVVTGLSLQETKNSVSICGSDVFSSIGDGLAATLHDFSFADRVTESPLSNGHTSLTATPTRMSQIVNTIRDVSMRRLSLVGKMTTPQKKMKVVAAGSPKPSRITSPPRHAAAAKMATPISTRLPRFTGNGGFTSRRES